MNNFRADETRRCQERLHEHLLSLDTLATKVRELCTAVDKLENENLELAAAAEDSLRIGSIVEYHGMLGKIREIDANLDVCIECPALDCQKLIDTKRNELALKEDAKDAEEAFEVVRLAALRNRLGDMRLLRSEEGREAALKIDPRWDTAGFEAWCQKSQIGWLRVGWLRSQANLGLQVPRRQELPPEACHIGVPPSDVNLYAVSWTWFGPKSPDPECNMLRQLVRELEEDGALNSDLAFIDQGSLFQPPRTPEEQSFYEAYLGSFVFLSTYFRLKVIVLADLEDRRPYFERGWPNVEFNLSTYCLPIVNYTRSESVRNRMTAEFLMSFEDKLVQGHFAFTQPMDRAFTAIKRLETALSMPRAQIDRLGFDTSCRQAQYRWVRVSYLRSLQRRGSVAPRYQDMPEGTHVDGVVPHGSQAFVVSYSWSAHLHAFPGGGKIREIVATLDELHANNDDLVFIDFLSLPQAERDLPKIYAKDNPQAQVCASKEVGFIALPPPSEKQKMQARFALFQSTRLYAFEECKVIVLPDLEEPATFPDHGDIHERQNTHCSPPRKELHTNWGYCKSVPYVQGGWTCAEYAVARLSGTIANRHHPSVRRVEASRNWPTTAADYAQMMNDDALMPVIFTKGGDREAVRFNFYKYCYTFSKGENAH